ncbi:hypothetical protein ACOMHN_058841 [Nucella lapillus]
MCRVLLRMKCATQSRLLQNVLCRVENDEVYAVRRCDIVITVTVVMKNTTLGPQSATPGARHSLAAASPAMEQSLEHRLVQSSSVLLEHVLDPPDWL